jgi:4a-hydroxytetrahydrobiopterin dehydratase
MKELSARKCMPCEGGVPPLTADFYRTMSFVNALAHIANTEDHHPDLKLGYNYCHVTFSTHSIGGLSENDFICAAKLDKL